jgi:phosphatidylserine/phosphatidylglycerophosphate/cardiolipin synthase-like enzyme
MESLRSAVFTLQGSLESSYWQHRLGINPEEIIDPLKDLNSMEIQTIKIISNAEKYIKIFAGSFGWYEKVRSELIKAQKKGVEVKIIMNTSVPESLEKAKSFINDGMQVRSYRETWYPIRGTLADGNNLVFLIWATEKTKVTKPIHFRPHYTKNPGLIMIFSDAFERKWNEAIAIS